MFNHKLTKLENIIPKFTKIPAVANAASLFSKLILSELSIWK